MLRLSVAYALLDGSATIRGRAPRRRGSCVQHCEATIKPSICASGAGLGSTETLAALKEGSRWLDAVSSATCSSHSPRSSCCGTRRVGRSRLAHTIAVESGGRPRIVTQLMNAVGRSSLSKVERPFVAFVAASVAGSVAPNSSR